MKKVNPLFHFVKVVELRLKQTWAYLLILTTVIIFI